MPRGSSGRSGPGFGAGVSDVGSVGRDRQGGRRSLGAKTPKKDTLKDPTSKDTLVQNGPEPLAPVDVDKNAIAKALRKGRGRRASVLSSGGNQGLGVTNVARPGGRAAKILFG